MEANKEFGRRQLPDRNPARPSDAASSPSTVAAVAAVLAAFLAAPLIRQIGGILVGVAIVVLLVFAYVGMMKGFGRALDQQWSQNAIGYPGVEDAYNRRNDHDSLLQQIHNNCKSRSDLVRLPRGHDRALDGFDGLYAGEWSIARAAYYLACLTAEQPERLCRPAHRSHLIAALKDYYRLIARVREERLLAASGPFAAERMSLMRAPQDDGSPMRLPSARTDQRVVEGLRRLVTEGYLTTRDLAAVLESSSDLAPALAGVEPKRKGCG